MSREDIPPSSHEMKDLVMGLEGEFPVGKLNEEDLRKIKVNIGCDTERKVVIVDFGTPVRCIVFSPEIAVSMASSLLHQLNILAMGVNSEYEKKGNSLGKQPNKDKSN